MYLPSTTSVVATILLLATHDDVSTIDAFSNSAITSISHRTSTNLFARIFEFDDDLEAARKKLEDLVGSVTSAEYQQQQQSSREVHESEHVLTSPRTYILPVDSSLPIAPKIDISMPPLPPLTTIERERRSAEMALLSQLADGDDGMADILSFWSSERGSKTAEVLKEADELISEGAEGWNQAEEILRLLIEEHGVYFVEPVNRLSTLLYLQGRLEESLHLTQMVLKAKPWHVQALSRIVIIYAALGDSESARRWAAHRLPTISTSRSNRRRSRWVERAVLDVHNSLEDAERRLADSFGKSDREWIASAPKISIDDDDEVTAWQ